MNYTALTLQGMNPTQLEQLRLQVCLDFFAPESTDADREVLGKFDDAIKCCIPHSFVLASLFTDVETMTHEVPDHVLESDPSLEWVTCPCCDGERWLEVEGNIWTKALFSDPRRAYAHRHVNRHYISCSRCNGEGEVLDSLEAMASIPTSHQLFEIKMTVKNPRSTPVTTDFFENTPRGSLPKLTKPSSLYL
jgi:hypothetical protein